MNKLITRTYTLIAGGLLPAGLTAVAASVPATPAKPNIVCILVDDLGYGELSCQGFAKDVRTPHIDKLLNGGVRFTNFYANSNVSSPSRAALLTGCYPDMAGVPGVIRTHVEDSWGYLSPNATLLPQVLKKNGYHTAIVGKWHLGLQSPNTPNERGFDYFHGFLGDMMDDYYNHLRWGNNYMRENTTIINPQGHATEVFTDWSIDYFNDRKKETNPFFLYLAYNAPHVPLQPPAEWLEKIKKREKDMPERRALLVALIEHLDEQVGRVVAALEANKQLENTIIIFTSDNGGEGAISNNGPVRGQKGQMYEGGIRVAAGVYWKGKIKPAVTENFAMLSDLFPTICEVAGASFQHPIDGISIWPTIKGERQITDDRNVFWVRREGGFLFGGQSCYAARYKNHKILQNTPFEPLQYFDMAADPKEQSPLPLQSTDAFKRLFAEQMEHIRKAGAIPWQSEQ